MPRVNLGKPDPKKVRLQTMIDEGMHRLGLQTRSEVAKLSRIPKSSFCSNYNNPDNFKLGEIKQIFNALKIPNEERTGII